jgi:hypothetical protein
MDLKYRIEVEVLQSFGGNGIRAWDMQEVLHAGPVMMATSYNNPLDKYRVISAETDWRPSMGSVMTQMQAWIDSADRQGWATSWDRDSVKPQTCPNSGHAEQHETRATLVSEADISRTHYQEGEMCVEQIALRLISEINTDTAWAFTLVGGRTIFGYGDKKNPKFVSLQVNDENHDIEWPEPAAGLPKTFFQKVWITRDMFELIEQDEDDNAKFELASMVLSFVYLGCESHIWKTIDTACVIVHPVKAYRIDLSGGGFYWHVPGLLPDAPAEVLVLGDKMREIQIDKPAGWQPSRTPLLLDDAPAELIID